MKRLLLALCFALAAVPAMADSIDGIWCGTQGQRMEIRGNTLITPRGVTTQGDYSRHAFRYTVPQGEEGAGAQKYLRLRGETLVHEFPADNLNAEPVVWNKCELRS